MLAESEFEFEIGLVQLLLMSPISHINNPSKKSRVNSVKKWFYELISRCLANLIFFIQIERNRKRKLAFIELMTFFSRNRKGNSFKADDVRIRIEIFGALVEERKHSSQVSLAFI